MRNMSFALTAWQVRNRTKTVTRRIGWRFAKVGDVVQPVVKGQGLKKGETVERIGGPIRIIAVNRERVGDLLLHEPRGFMEVQREGFGGELTPRMFVELFCQHNNCGRHDYVTRIEFEYVDTLADVAATVSRARRARRLNRFVERLS